MSETASASTSIPPGLPVTDTAADQPNPDKKKKKKSKVRSAWISFVGRILAQMCGAVATVVIGLQLVQGYFPAASAADSSAIIANDTDPVVRPSRTDGAKVLAVLPVANYSGDARDDAFADGLTETLVSELAQVPGLHVTSRTSSMHFRNNGGLLPQIARQLGADLVVESSVVTSDGRLRISVQLIDAASDFHIWVRRFELADRDVLSLQFAVAKAVAGDVAGIVE